MVLTLWEKERKKTVKYIFQSQSFILLQNLNETHQINISANSMYNYSQNMLKKSGLFFIVLFPTIVQL